MTLASAEYLLAEQSDRPRRILCYGDSNTWGTDPKTGWRLLNRWPTVLAKHLGDGYQVLEAGLRGRTTGIDDALLPGRNGLMHLLPCVLSHQPVDLLILMLGSNDLKSRYGDQSRSTAHGLARMVDAVRSSQSPNPSDRVPEILVVISPKVIQPSRRMEQEFGEVTGAEAVRVECISICKSLGVSFLDANLIIRSSDEDGVHIDEAAHSILATHLAAQIHGMGQRNLVETGRAQRAGNPPSVSAPIEY